MNIVRSVHFFLNDSCISPKKKFTLQTISACKEVESVESLTIKP